MDRWIWCGVSLGAKTLNKYKTRSLILLIGALITGCVERAETSFPEQSIEPIDMGDAMEADLGLGEGSGAGTMEGTWLLVHENSSCVLGQEQVSVADYLIDIEQQGQALRETRTICSLDLSPVLGLNVTVPPAAFQSVEYADVDLGFFSALGEGGGYSSSLELALWGVRLDDPFFEELPRDVEDARVFDADSDGAPGVTFIVGDNVCERHTIQRQLIHYTGSFTAPNRIDGSSTNLTETLVIGGTSPICKTSPAVESNDSFNQFVMVRVDGQGGAIDLDADNDGAITCDEIKGASVTLIPGREPANANCR